MDEPLHWAELIYFALKNSAAYEAKRRRNNRPDGCVHPIVALIRLAYAWRTK